MIHLCRQLLSTLTPLKVNCGKLCGAVCCESIEGEETGMLLFPGEEEFYQSASWAKLVPTDHGTLLVCNGSCERDDRPLACRLYPLFPKVTPGGIRVVSDARAKGLCPLAQQRLSAYDPDFVAAVQQVGEALMTQNDTRLFLQRMTEQQNDLIELRKLWGGI